MYEIYERNVIMKRKLIALLVAVVVILSISLPALASEATFKACGYTLYYSDSTKKFWVELYGNEAGRIDRFKACWNLADGRSLYGSTRDVGFGQRICAYSAPVSFSTQVIGGGYTIWRVQ
jgi:hypothetical protein